MICGCLSNRSDKSNISLAFLRLGGYSLISDYLSFLFFSFLAKFKKSFHR